MYKRDREKWPNKEEECQEPRKVYEKNKEIHREMTQRM